MPVVFAGSPDIAHRSLSADPAEKKLYSSRITMQKMLRLSLNINVCTANWQNSTKNQTSCSRVKHRDLIEISSKVFSCVYMEEEHPVPRVQHPALSCHCWCHGTCWALRGASRDTEPATRVSVAKMPHQCFWCQNKTVNFTNCEQFVKSGLKAPNKNDIWNSKKFLHFLMLSSLTSRWTHSTCQQVWYFLCHE